MKTLELTATEIHKPLTDDELHGVPRIAINRDLAMVLQDARDAMAWRVYCVLHHRLKAVDMHIQRLEGTLNPRVTRSTKKRNNDGMMLTQQKAAKREIEEQITRLIKAYGPLSPL
jgi:hypothetical protein